MDYTTLFDGSPRKLCNASAQGGQYWPIDWPARQGGNNYIKQHYFVCILYSNPAGQYYCKKIRKYGFFSFSVLFEKYWPAGQPGRHLKYGSK